MAQYAKKAQQPSEQSRQEAERIAKGIQKPGQTKEQTRLIAQGIQKGIALYKKQQKAKLREQDKQRKKQQRQKLNETFAAEPEETVELQGSGRALPWALLGLSWIGFAAYLAWSQGLLSH